MPASALTSESCAWRRNGARKGNDKGKERVVLEMYKLMTSTLGFFGSVGSGLFVFLFVCGLPLASLEIEEEILIICSYPR